MSTKMLTLVPLAAAVVASAGVMVTVDASCHPDSCMQATEEMLCGSDGVTYRSLCELELAQCSRSELKIASHGACAIATTAAETSKCDEKCEDHAYPLCGSDGVTYLNACYFDRAYCRNNELTPMGYGACKTATAQAKSLRS